MSTSNRGGAEDLATRFQVSIARHTIETSGIRLLLSEEQKATSGVGALWRPDPSPAILAGVAYGPVNMIVRLDPHLRPLDIEYEDAVVVPVEVTGPISFFGELETPGVDVPVFHLPDGRHVIQVSSTGADLNYDLTVTEASQTITVELLHEVNPEPRCLMVQSRAAASFAGSARDSFAGQKSARPSRGPGAVASS